MFIINDNLLFLEKILNSKNYLFNIDKKYKRYMWNGTLPKDIHEKYNNLLELYNFLKTTLI